MEVWNYCNPKTDVCAMIRDWQKGYNILIYQTFLWSNWAKHMPGLNFKLTLSGNIFYLKVYMLLSNSFIIRLSYIYKALKLVQNWPIYKNMEFLFPWSLLPIFYHFIEVRKQLKGGGKDNIKTFFIYYQFSCPFWPTFWSFMAFFLSP